MTHLSLLSTAAGSTKGLLGIGPIVAVPAP